MSKKQARPNKRYPSARLKGMREIFWIIRDDSEWKPESINAATLKTLEFAKGRETESVFALKFLGVIDEDGKPTAEFDELRKDFHETLAKLTTRSYSELFDTIPKKMIRQNTLVNFFIQEGYSRDTAEYQAKLFAWLCEEAKIELPSIEARFKRARFEKDK